MKQHDPVNLQRVFSKKSGQPPSRLTRQLEIWSRRVTTSALIKALVVCVFLLAATLLFVLAQASANSDFFDKNYAWLYRLNITVGSALTLIVGFLIIRLFLLYRSGRFGTRLLAKLAFIFALVGVLPGVILYSMSLQFVTRSIESWFDVKVETALESGLNLGRVSLDSLMNELMTKAGNMSLQLTESKVDSLAPNLNRVREQFSVQDATLISGNGRLIATASASLNNNATIAANVPSTSVLRQAKLTRMYTSIEGADFDSDTPANATINNQILLRVIVPINLASSLYDRSDESSPPPVNTSSLLNNPDSPTSSGLKPGTSQGITKNLAGSLMGELVYLQLTQTVPTNLAANALAVQNAYREYQEKSLSRIGLRKMYIGTLTLTLCLGIFSALVLAVLLGNQLARPLLLLAEGTKAVAGGDFSPLNNHNSNDELGVLTESFNAMVRQLSDAREDVQRHGAALEDTNLYLKNILANLSAGVLVLDAQFRITLANQGAERILRCAMRDLTGSTLASHPDFAVFSEQIERGFLEQNARINKALKTTIFQTGQPFDERGHTWQRQIELALPDSHETISQLGLEPDQDDNNNASATLTSTLLVRGSRLPLQAGAGYIVIFDDISDVISAQRSIAWGEVARRLAHEIKNPLTPIQLSAERLAMKLADKLDEKDAGMLKRSTQTIVNQVQAMKQMVDAFRDYARMPPAVMSSLDLNELVTDVLNLYAAEEERGEILVALAPNLPRLQGDASKLRQVIHNLIQNAQDAAASQTKPQILIRTESISGGRGPQDKVQTIKITITDNGTGFPPALLARVFEPYITTKSKGTGLGLAVVKKIIDEHEGRITISNLTDENAGTNSTIKGAQVVILFSKLTDHAPHEENLMTSPKANEKSTA